MAQKSHLPWKGHFLLILQGGTSTSTIIVSSQISKAVVVYVYARVCWMGLLASLIYIIGSIS